MIIIYKLLYKKWSVTKIHYQNNILKCDMLKIMDLIGVLFLLNMFMRNLYR